MSHAANLRNSQRAQEVPTKKRKLSQNGTRPLVNGVNGLLNDRSISSISAAAVKDAKSLKQRRTDTSIAKIRHADGDVNAVPRSQDVVEISSDESDDDGDEYESEARDQIEPRRDRDSLRNDEIATTTSGTIARHQDADNVETGKQMVIDEAGIQQTMDEAQNTSEPSFGDLLTSRHGAVVDVTAHNDDYDQAVAVPETAVDSRSQRNKLPLRDANSLGTVLSQALRTNDTPLLESCLAVHNLRSIRATIERLPSQQAASLLRKLAERMHNRPGRAGSLMVWIQWTIVAHGGYLATQPVVMDHLRELYRVVKMRANALQPLLALKGKLDMLEAQLSLRKSRATQSTQARAGRNEGVVYIEGEDSDTDSDDNDDTDMRQIDNTTLTSTTIPRLHRELTVETDDEADDVPMTNGVSQGDEGKLSSDDEAGTDDEDDEDLIDDEAEETNSDEEELDEEVGFEDVDDDEEAAGEEKEPAPKRNKKSAR